MVNNILRLGMFEIKKIAELVTSLYVAMYLSLSCVVVNGRVTHTHPTCNTVCGSVLT